MDTIELLRTRCSVRRYTDRPIEQGVIEAIVDCGRLAPSSHNLQPWHFVVVTKASTLADLAALADNGRFIASSAACIAVFGNTAAQRYLEDGAAATENMIIAAWTYGIGSCWVAGYDTEYATEVRLLLGVPEDYRLVSLVALGYPVGAKLLRCSKKSLSEMLHWNYFQGASKDGSRGNV